MCNIEITFDFASRNIYIINSDVFTRLHRSLFNNTFAIRIYSTFRSFCIYIRGWTFVDARLLPISRLVHTRIVKWPQMYKASDSRHTQMVLYTRARTRFTRIKGFSYSHNEIRENDFLRYRCMKNRRGLEILRELN